ncbi:MAG: TRAM domain-containing protein [Candidatus Aenigmarchaeota archaeon]|nr:TRAM domain-containing protein [Candidatus Aenigmarchaeota archaeon]
MFGRREFRITRSHKKKDKYTKKKPPVKKGDVVSIYIKDTTKRGDGVGKVEDFAVFVEGAREGEIVRVKIVEIKKNCAVGKKVE